MHLDFTHSLPLHHLQSEAHLESSLTSAVELFCRNSQPAKVIGRFHRGVPSWIFDRVFDRIINSIMPNNLL